MPPPVPPRVKAGRMMSGKRPICLGDGARFLQGVGDAADRHVQPDREHQVLEDLAVLAPLDGLGVGADHLDAVFLEHAAAVEGHGGVQRGLAAEGGQQDQLVGIGDSGSELGSTGTPRRCISSTSRAMIFSTHSGVIGSM